jgi:L-ascorbate metabolism protein UlaG (beta-lactamase superfamily)
MASDAEVTLTWLGHAATKLEYDGKTILIDPFLQDNPATPAGQKQQPEIDLMLITHGHFDHFADAVPLARASGCQVICIFEIAQYLKAKGIDHVVDMNKGGTVDWNGFQVAMVDAVHSSGIVDGDQIVYGGTAAGFVIRFPNGFTVYHAGDTDLFEGFRIIGRQYRPDVALIPIGGHYVMDPHLAAEAIRMLDITSVIPIHYGTWPILKGTPDELKREAGDIAGLTVVALEPGQSVRQSDLV